MNRRDQPGTVLVTGAAGFVGRTLVRQLVQRKWTVRAAMRSVASLCVPDEVEVVTIPSMDGQTDWSAALQGVEAVVHLAATAHVKRDSGRETLYLYQAVNVDGTAALAAAAIVAGVKRFVFLSSIGVNGDRTDTQPFNESSIPCPRGAYACSKWEAEQALWGQVSGTSMQSVVIRPPMAYGPNAPGNFRRLMRLLQSGIPIPLASVQNQRSFIYVGNLCDAICECLENQSAAGQTFVVSDGEDVSTACLIRLLSKGLGLPARLLSFSPTLLHQAASAMGFRYEAERLLQSLVVDSTRIRRVLGWIPPFSLEDGLRATALAYLCREHNSMPLPYGTAGM